MAQANVCYGTTGNIGALLDKSVTQSYINLGAEMNEHVIAEYVWIGGTGMDLRSKSRVYKAADIGVDLSNGKPNLPDPSKLSTWNYDGSSTGQAPGDDSEVFIVPRAVFRDPFMRAPHILVLCDTYVPPAVKEDGTLGEMTPLPTNSRAAAVKIMDNPKVVAEEPWFGIEQEYTLLNSTTKWPLGWPSSGFPMPQGPYYCSAGAGRSIARDVAQSHMMACLYAGVKISGVNAEVMPAQWEYQVGPCIGIEAGDHMVISRYIMDRLGEEYNVDCSFDPKPVPGDWNGAGCHTNYSTKSTREGPTGFDAIKAQIEKLGKRHALHVAAYGEGNDRRLTGAHETSSMHDFSWGVANRGCSVRVGRMVPVEKCGYYEDRRPASNMDPYLVTSLIAESTLLT